MDRRTLLTSIAVGTAVGAGAGVAAGGLAGGAAGGLAAGGPAAVVAASDAVRLNLVTTWPKGMPGLGSMSERLAERCLALSNGTLDIKVYAAGELVGAFEVFDAVATGSADMYHGAEYYWQGKHPAYPFFTAVPFGMTALEQQAWLQFGGGQALWEELGARFGILPIACGNSTHQTGGWFKREIRSLADFRGLKMRIPGIGGELVRRLGGAAIAMPGGEIYQALQSGVIDAAEFLGPWNDLGLGFYREAPFYYAPGLHEPGALLALGVSRRVWDRLSPLHQQVIRTACQDVTLTSFAEFCWRNAEFLGVLERDHGVTVRAFPDDVMTAAARISREMWAEAGSSDDLGRRIYENWLAAFRQMRPWMEDVECRYVSLRKQHLAADA
jgi:TRAP-type mannitol/chloroaromatic compound transport system substrate-binding protein